MSFELKAALEGNLAEALKAEVAAGERAAMKAVRNVSDRAKLRLRDQVTGAGMGPRLANTWRANVYPSHGQSLNAAALVFTKAPIIVRAFDEGVTIRSKEGFWLAIPTDAVPKNVSFNDASGVRQNRKRVTPGGLERALGVRLRFVYRPGKASLLVLDDARINKRGFARQASKTAIAKQRGVATVVMFILVPQVRLPKRFDVAKVEATALSELETEIVTQWKAETG